MGGFKICGMHGDPHQVVAFGATSTPPEMQECLKRRILSFMLCVNWVCAGNKEGHEWVSESTTAEQEDKVMGRALEYKPCVPCAVHWSMLLFSAPTRLNSILRKKLTSNKYNEVFNTAVFDAISRPYRNKHTPRTCMMKSIAKVLTQDTHKGASKQRDGRR